MPVTTTQPYNYFDDLDDGQFEDLVHDLLLRQGRTWDRLDPVGRAGSDRGRDIFGLERVEAKGRFTKTIQREWRIQVKRWKKVTLPELRKIVREVIPDVSLPPHGLVVALACRASDAGFDAFHEEAAARGSVEHDLWSRDKLNRLLLLPENANLRAFYFGDGYAVEGTVRIPLALDQSPGRDLPLLGREEQLAALLDGDRDVILEGRPASGKSRLALEAPGVRFLSHDAGSDAIADSLRRHHPRFVVLDDAGFDLRRLRTLLELRRADYRFSIIATIWPEHRREVERLLPKADRIQLPLLERKVVDEIVQAQGVTNPYLRHDILDQAGGRPGWAIALAELARRGKTSDVISGKGIIDEVEPYLRRVGATSVEALGLISVIAALGEASPREMSEVDKFVGIGRLERQKLLEQAAAAGVLDPRPDGALRVAPAALRFALAAHWFYGQQPAPWPLGEVLEGWPEHRSEIVLVALTAAESGSAKARNHLETLVGSVRELPEHLLKRYTALDEAAAGRAVTEAGGLRFAALSIAARRFALPEAVRALLDLALGDDRPENQHSDHPVRLLGEIGTRITPLGDSTFAARQAILDTATRWFDEEPTDERGLIWARLVAYLLTPNVEGNYTDPGSPMTIHLQAGFESSDHLREIDARLWPIVNARLARLKAPALVVVIEAVDQWARVARGFEGAFGAKPHPAAQAIAARVGQQMALAIAQASVDKPAAQIKLQDTSRILGLGLRQPIDPEFRVLTWRAWRALRRGHDRLVRRSADRLAACWAKEDPSAVMNRVARIASEVKRTRGDLQPMVNVLMESLISQVGEAEPWIDAGMGAGLTYELAALLRASLAQTTDIPRWLPTALASPSRHTAIRVALEPSLNSRTAKEVLEALDEHDIWLIEGIIWSRSRGAFDEICRALLRHPVDLVRAAASLCFGLDPKDHVPMLPADWYAEWAEAFVVVPLQGLGGENHRLGELLAQLVTRDPHLVERWLVRVLSQDFTRAAYSLPAHAALSRLPRSDRDSLMRRFGSEPASYQLLAQLLGDDIDWLGDLLNDHVIEQDDALTALGNIGDDGPARIPQILRLAPVLVTHGVEPDAVAYQALFGGHMGEASVYSERLRAAFARAPQCEDETVERVRLAGIRLFTAERDQQAKTEHERRIAGEL